SGLVPAIATPTMTAYWPASASVSAQRMSRSTRTAAAARLPPQGPNAASPRPTGPAGTNNAQLSMSTARANALRTQAAATQKGASGPAAACVTPMTVNAPTPSSVIVGAATFQPDTNDTSAVVEKTTRTRRAGLAMLGISDEIMSGVW